MTFRLSRPGLETSNFRPANWRIGSIVCLSCCLMFVGCDGEVKTSPLAQLEAERPWNQKVVIVKRIELNGTSILETADALRCARSEMLDFNAVIEDGSLRLDRMTTKWSGGGTLTMLSYRPGSPDVTLPSITIFQVPLDVDHGVLRSSLMEARQSTTENPRNVHDIRGSIQAPETPGTYVVDLELFDHTVKEFSTTITDGKRIPLYRRELIVE